MSETTPATLVLSDGGLEGLIAAAMAVERAAPPVDRHVHLWAVPGAFEGADVVRETAQAAALRQASLLRMGIVSARVPASATHAGEVDSGLLLRAGSIAAELGCRRVLWAVRAPRDRATGGVDVDAASRAMDRALLVSRLVELDLETTPGGPPEVRVETPLVDLSDEQVADLALDLSVPLESVWWMRDGLEGRGAQLAAAERERWGALISGVGV
jgi:hypothetical protein